MEGLMGWGGESSLWDKKKAPQLCLGCGQSQVPSSMSVWEGTSLHSIHILEQLTPRPWAPSLGLWLALVPLLQAVR